MQSEDTIDSFFTVNSNSKFDNLKDESMDVNVAVCSVIPRIDFVSTGRLTECDGISNSSVPSLAAFRPSIMMEQSLPSTLELFTPSILDKTPNQSVISGKNLVLV